MDTSLVRECAVPAVEGLKYDPTSDRKKTRVIGFMNGTLTYTASATKFSISRSIGRLYLDLTYSGLAAYRHATSPPRGVIPTLSPIPRTAVFHSEPSTRINNEGTDMCRYVWHQLPERCMH